MTSNWYERLKDFAVKYIPCEFCGAAPGSGCWTVQSKHPGFPTPYVHASRTWPVQQMWTWGFEEGVEDGKFQVERERERANRA